MGYRIAVLTDHATHSASNSVYGIVKGFLKHEAIDQVDVISRSDSRNEAFFKGVEYKILLAHKARMDFDFPADRFFQEEVFETNLDHYDFILLRLPRPVTDTFFEKLSSLFPEQKIINKPSGIRKTGNKKYLLNFPNQTAPMKICSSIEDIKAFKKDYPLVLKPFEEYGGKGIIKIIGDTVWLGNISQISFADFEKKYAAKPSPYLAMKYLKNVSNGDKRIVVANGKVLATSLRLPGKGMWLCNVAQGGASLDALPDKRELEIIEHINPFLKKEGIFLYGLDTLEEDDGRRVISEINTLSVGGITPAEQNSGLPITRDFADQFVEYIKQL